MKAEKRREEAAMRAREAEMRAKEAEMRALELIGLEMVSIPRRHVSYGGFER